MVGRLSGRLLLNGQHIWLFSALILTSCDPCDGCSEFLSLLVVSVHCSLAVQSLLEVL